MYIAYEYGSWKIHKVFIEKHILNEKTSGVLPQQACIPYTFLGKRTWSLETTGRTEMETWRKKKKEVNHQTILFWFMISAGVDELHGSLNNEWKRKLVIFWAKMKICFISWRDNHRGKVTPSKLTIYHPN